MPQDALDLEAYFLRIGSSPRGAPSLPVLTALHEAHVGAVPFENLDLLLGKPISLELPDLQAKLVTGRRGGYCFEHNTLFAAVLERLGFRVTPLAARVRQGVSALRPRTHMLLRVDLPEGPFLADVGFGGDGPVHPVPLVAGPETRPGDNAFRLRREGEAWVLEGAIAGVWSDLYVFTLEPQYPVDFEMANHFTSTYPKSPFLLNLVAQRSWLGRRIVLRNRDLTLQEGRGTEATVLRDPAHLLEVLDRHFGIAFPAGTRFSRPEFS